MEDNKQIINKIKKLMAIANDPSASDQEIQLSLYKANKLMIQHKIREIDLYDKRLEEEEVVEVDLNYKGSGYIHWSIQVVSEHFRCRSYYYGKINRDNCEFGIIGLKSDVEILKPIVEGLIYYLNNNIMDLKECYIGLEDFRIFKREYLKGFANGLKNVMNRSLIEMSLDEKYEIAIIGVPEKVKNYADKNIRNLKSKFESYSEDAYMLGMKDGTSYDVDRKNLLKNDQNVF